MGKAGRRRLEHLEQGREHGQIVLHLFLVQPALDQVIALVQGDVEQVGRPGERLAVPPHAVRRGEIDRKVGCAGDSVRTARDAEQVPVTETGEVLERGTAEKSGCAGDKQHGSRHRLACLRFAARRSIRSGAASGSAPSAKIRCFWIFCDPVFGNEVTKRIQPGHL